jgi:hypothetical protein
MAQEKIVVEGAPRATRGKTRGLRLTGKFPPSLWRQGEAITLALNAKQVGAILRSGGHNTSFKWIGGKARTAI